MTELLTSNGLAEDEVLRRFRELASAVYRDDPIWAPQSEDAIDDCLRLTRDGEIEIEIVVATSAGRTEARAMAINPISAAGGLEEGRIGLYECLPDTEDSGITALTQCRDWLRGRGMKQVVAPRIDHLRAGLQIAGFELPQTLFTAHNPARYASTFRKVFDRETRMVSFVFSRDRAPRFRTRKSELFSVRSLDGSRLDSELRNIEAFQRDVFAGRLGYVARSEETARQTASRLLPLADPDLITIAHDSDDRVIGLLICLPDRWQHKPDIDRARLVSVGVAPNWRRRGVAMAMGAHLASVLLDRGYVTLEGSWVLESNRRTRYLAKLLGARPGREFALFTADLA